MLTHCSPASTASLDAVQEKDEQEANVDTAKIAAAQALRDRSIRKVRRPSLLSLRFADTAHNRGFAAQPY